MRRAAEEESMKLSEGRILTTHAGSLPRPRALTELYARRAHGEPVEQAKLDQAAREATRWAVAKQREAGVDVANDGEQAREGFFLYVQHRMSGFGGRWKRPPWKDLASYPEFMAQRREWLSRREAVSNFDPPMAVGEVRYANRAALDEEIAQFEAALQAAGGAFAEVFMTAPSPGIVAAALKNRHYATEEAYLDALAEALRVEFEAAVERGWLLQIDAPDLALERHISYAERPVREFVGFVERVIASINRALRNVPRERVRLHVCWGNYEGPHDRDVALREILPTILQANVGGFVLPFANPRHSHEVDLFKEIRLQDDQALVAGVIDTTTNYIEHPEVVAERLQRAARAVGDPRRVLAGTDCGFDTSAGMGRVASDVAWGKLKAMRQGADLASERLFR
jgi:5-methyltetrahydropteroyltriglutamate--homocysteine methyltransferase